VRQQWRDGAERRAIVGVNGAELMRRGRRGSLTSLGNAGTLAGRVPAEVVMGRKTGSESAVALIGCFLEREGTWAQAALARRVGLTVASVRRKLVELQEAGVPLEREGEPPQVYWSVPKKGWLPGTIRLEEGEVADLMRLPKSAKRSQLLARVLERYVGNKAAPAENVVVAPALGDAQEQWLTLVEDAASRGEALEMRYVSASRGAVETRKVSPHRVVMEGHTRFVATCHTSGALKWFRVDRITYAKLAGAGEARRAAEAAVDELLATSVNGFRGPEEASEVRFRVRDPEARWVEGNLPSPLVATKEAGELVVTGRTAALLQVARFVAGLGAAATCESPELRAVVRDLAEGALAALGPSAVTERAASRADRRGVGVTT